MAHKTIPGGYTIMSEVGSSQFTIPSHLAFVSPLCWKRNTQTPEHNLQETGQVLVPLSPT